MNDAFDQLTATLDKLYGAPAVVLTLCFCIGLGYFLKMMECVPNKRIPWFVVAWGIVWNVLLRPLPAQDTTVYQYVQHFGRLAAVGFLIGLAACILYDKVLRKLEVKFPWLGQLLATADGNGKEKGGQDRKTET